mmetsp:Transcript_26250/g.53519  ORF Transcript_26250/g.53519 Transcript_26250/m.53519 type:complete len:424 (-) Transcript_26250:81-1352(-)
MQSMATMPTEFGGGSLSDDSEDNEWGKRSSKRSSTRKTGGRRTRARRTVNTVNNGAAANEETEAGLIGHGIGIPPSVPGIRRLRKPVRDRIAWLHDTATGITSAYNKARVSVSVGGGVVYKLPDSGNEWGVTIGLVVAMEPSQNSSISVTVVRYEFAPVGDWDEYLEDYPARSLPHRVLQSTRRFKVDIQSITQAVTVLPLLFWEPGFAGGRPDFFCVGGHLVGQDGDLTMVAPVATSPRLRVTWADIILGGSGVSSVVDMLRRNLQFRLTHWLDKRADQDRCGVIDVISLENVPSSFVYVALGSKWVEEHRDACEYRATSRQHQVSGSCEDFVPIFGYNIQQTVVSSTSAIMGVASSGLMLVTEGVGMAPVTLRWSPNRPGTLHVILGGIEVLGPPQPGGERCTLWSTKRNARAARTKQIMI